MKYKHISFQERELICIGVQTGKSYRQIARELNRSHSSIVRELKRNRLYGSRPTLAKHPYLATHAQKKAANRARLQREKAPLKSHEIFCYVREKLRNDHWSPETISGRLCIDKPGLKIHHETIYRYIYSKSVKNRFKLWQYLTLSRKKRRVKTGRQVHKYQGKIPGAVSIELRSKEANQRLTIGHWESDDMEGKKGEKQAFSVNVDRKVRVTKLDLMNDQTAISKEQSVIKSLGGLPRKTITYDNGKENSHHREIAQALQVDTFFCHAYHSWEKGTVENTIGRIRRYIPKGSSLKHITRKQVAWIEDQLNNTPRKCLNWMTPYEAMAQEMQNTNDQLAL